MYTPFVKNRAVDEINKLKTVQNLILTSAIMSAIFAVPLLGMILGMFLQIPMIVLLIISCVGRGKMRELPFSKGSLTITLVASIVSLISGVFFVLYAVFVGNGADLSREFLPQITFMSYLIIGFCAWILYVVATIMLLSSLQEFNREIQRYIAQTLYNSQQQQSVSVMSNYYVEHPVGVSLSDGAVTNQVINSPFHAPKESSRSDNSDALI